MDVQPFHDFGDITLRSISVSEMANNVYLLTQRKTGVQILIDAAADAPAILQLIAEGAGDAEVPASVQLIFTTHQHWDHVRALAELKQSTGAATACGADDADGIEVPMDRTVGDGDRIDLPGIGLDLIHLRGHTPGSIALVLRPDNAPVQIFTGDCLFPGGVGKTNSPAEFASLIDDVSSRIFEVYDDDTVAHPGHGNPTTLGAERASLPQWRERGW